MNRLAFALLLWIMISCQKRIYMEELNKANYVYSAMLHHKDEHGEWPAKLSLVNFASPRIQEMTRNQTIECYLVKENNKEVLVIIYNHSASGEALVRINYGAFDHSKHLETQVRSTGHSIRW